MNAHVAPPVGYGHAQAREFLARVIAWPQEEVASAFVNLHYTFEPLDGSVRTDKKGKRLLPWAGRACRTLDEAIKTLELQTKAGTNARDIYLCLSTQAKAEAKTGKKNLTYYKPIRLQENVVTLKSIFLDIDFKGGDHGYDTPIEAVDALARFIAETNLPKPTAIVRSGGGLHVYWCVVSALTRAEWEPLAFALAEATKRHGLKCDTQCTVDSVRVLRVPDTLNFKTNPPRLVTLAGKIREFDYPVDRLWQALEPFRIKLPGRGATAALVFEQVGGQLAKAFADIPLTDKLGANLGPHFDPVHLDDLAKVCGFIDEAIKTGGATYTNPMWNLTTLIAVFTDDPRNDAHRMGDQHPGYTKESTDEFFDRKAREKEEKGLGFPSCASISGSGCTACQACPHLANGRSPLAALPRKVTVPADEPFFADPYSAFVGPAFPTSSLPPVLADFVNAEHRAMGADPAALAMAALAGVAAALTAETKVQVGDSWDERPILWIAIVGDPSTMKSPIVAKSAKPLHKIDCDKDASWRQQKSIYDQLKATSNPNSGPYPAKPARCIVQDATPEKVAEILARAPSGSMMVHDELAGWIASFDRYGSGGSSRAFYLSAFNGGAYLKDRVGQGSRDENAEIRVDNLALNILGGIQPDRLAELRDLTSDGLLQRFLVVLMMPAKRGDQKYPVAAHEIAYANLIESVHKAPAARYQFATDAEPILSDVLDRLYELEQVQGFSPAFIGAIGKLKGYYARLALVLQVAAEHSAVLGGPPAPPTGLISKSTADSTARLLFKFLLPHTFGLYDVVANGGQDRDTIRSIGDFILASDKDRLRPSDFTTGVRRLRNQPGPKIAEWASRFCALGWLRPEDGNTAHPKAWLVEPGLRAQFSTRRQQAQNARAAAHAILKTGGTRR